MPFFILTIALILFASFTAKAEEKVSLVTFNDNAGWCWFQDERVLIDDKAGKLIFSSVASDAGKEGEMRGGNVEVTSYDFKTKAINRYVLHEKLGSDDHNAPSLFKRSDGRYVAAYTNHELDENIRMRVSEAPASISAWGKEQAVLHEDKVTYSNLLKMGNQLLNITRGVGQDPHFIYSEDEGNTWKKGGRILDAPDRPYLKYFSNGKHIYLVAANQHPRNLANNIFVGYIEGGKLYNLNGVIDDNLYDDDAVLVEKLTPIYLSRNKTTGWPVDIELDERGNPVMIFTVRKLNSKDDLAKEDADAKLGYFYAHVKKDHRGTMMVAMPLSYAGSPLYAEETDYAGLAAINPNNVKQVFISTNVDPVSQKPLISNQDGKQHYEIFEGRMNPDQRTWRWTAVTEHSVQDNIRPIMPRNKTGKTVLLWLRGEYKTFTDYDLETVGFIYENERE